MHRRAGTQPAPVRDRPTLQKTEGIVRDFQVSNERMAQRVTTSDLELVRRARTGDQAAFRQLVERYESQVAATAIGMLGPGSEAEDVGQNTFVRFYQALDRYRGDAAVGTYLTRIAMNLSLNALKRRKRDLQRFVRPSEERDDLLPAVDGEGRFERQERIALVQKAVAALPEKQRAVVVLRMIQGYSTKETADLLGLPLGTVLSRLARAQVRLKDELAPMVSEGAL